MLEFTSIQVQTDLLCAFLESITRAIQKSEQFQFYTIHTVSILDLNEVFMQR